MHRLQAENPTPAKSLAGCHYFYCSIDSYQFTKVTCVFLKLSILIDVRVTGISFCNNSNLSLVYYALALALKTFQGLLLYKLDCHADTELGIELPFNGIDKGPLLAHLIGEQGLLDLHHHCSPILMVLALDNDSIMGFGAVYVKKDGLDLGGKDVHTLDDQHIIGASQDTMHTVKGPATGTGTRQKTGQVPGPIGEKRCPLLLLSQYLILL
jgi:hypothetical protein